MIITNYIIINITNYAVLFGPLISCRLQGLVQGVYGERSRLRKKMVDLDASEREALRRMHRKVGARLCVGGQGSNLVVKTFC